MERAKIVEILEDWNFWTKKHDAGIPRPEYLGKLSRLAGTGQVIAVTGIRRSGKSTIMLQYIQKLIGDKVDPKNILYVNFEDARFKELDLDLLNRIYEVYLEYAQPDAKQHIFLDEVHKINGWEKFARTMHELKKASVFVSGSNTKMLSGELATVLTGRHLDLRVFPLEFKEFLLFNGVLTKDNLDLVSKRHKIKSLLSQYLEYGGFPLVCLKEQKKELLQAYFDDILSKDVVERHRVLHIGKLNSLAKFYLTNTGRRISLNRISKFLGVSLDTAERYSYYLEEAYLITFLKKFSPSVKVQERTMSVVYSADNGLWNLLGFKLSRNLGWLYQNTVANHLLKRHGRENLFYWMNDMQEEVDFVIKGERDVKQLIQVCYSTDEYETKRRETRALLKASKELKCKNLLVITENEEGEEEIEGKKISFVPLWKWLLQNK